MCHPPVCGMMHIKVGHSIREAVSRSSQCSTTGVTKVVVCVILFVG